MSYLSKFVMVVAAVLLWHVYHLNPDVAQLKDILQLLHSDEVHAHIGIGYVLLLLLDDSFLSSVSYVSVQRSTPNDHRFSGLAKSENK